MKQMKLAIAIDYDRTLSDESFVVRAEVRDYLKKARAKIKVIIASGREFSFFEENGLLDLGDAYVAENGAVLFVGGVKTVIENIYSDEIKTLLTRNNVPFSAGDAVISFKRTHASKVTDALKGFDIELEYNRDSIMILPKGVNKGSGASKAKELLGVNYLACIGDAENDLSIFRVSDYRGAVANAIDELKRAADYVCKKPYGDGVVEFLETLNRNDLISLD